jgi:hypothetical protein
MKISEVIIDNIRGAGATPYNQEVDYRGLRVMMKPSTFLELAAPMDSENVDRLVDFVKKGGAIASPFLTIKIPDAWKIEDFNTPADVWGHEGRHRMVACKKADGEKPIEVHFLFTHGIRARDIKSEWIKALNNGLMSEYQGVPSHFVKGPLFQVKE